MPLRILCKLHVRKLGLDIAVVEHERQDLVIYKPRVVGRHRPVLQEPLCALAIGTFGRHLRVFSGACYPDRNPDKGGQGALTHLAHQVVHRVVDVFDRHFANACFGPQLIESTVLACHDTRLIAVFVHDQGRTR